MAVWVNNTSVTLQLSETALNMLFLIANWSNILLKIVLSVSLPLEMELIVVKDKIEHFFTFAI